jgi:hypothetical protein
LTGLSLSTAGAIRKKVTMKNAKMAIGINSMKKLHCAHPPHLPDI